jgi:hypothetical protein
MVTNHSRTHTAEQRVAEARRMVSRQRRLIANLKSCNGYGNQEQEKELLAAFEKSLAIFEGDLATMTNALESRTVRSPC